MSEHAVVACTDLANDTRFLAYVLSTMNLGRLSGQAAQPGLSVKVLAQESICLPPLEDQRRIASILGSVDDLIENNRRRVQVLEEMARSIYREWFVHFRYTSQQSDDMVAQTGELPRGWTMATLGTVTANSDRHRRPLSGQQRRIRPGPFPYFGAAKLIDSVNGYLFDGEYLLFAEDGSVQTRDGYPVLQLVTGKFWANNHTHILQGSGVSTRYLYLASQQIPIAGYITGAAQPKITQGNLNRIPILVATKEIHRQFDLLTDPIFDEADCLRAQTRILIKTRDLLLPKLVSGEINVSSLDLDALVEGSSL
jgi:type I restriction enzyme S subunit